MLVKKEGLSIIIEPSKKGHNRPSTNVYVKILHPKHSVFYFSLPILILNRQIAKSFSNKIIDLVEVSRVHKLDKNNKCVGLEAVFSESATSCD